MLHNDSMLVGDPSVFTIESNITRAYHRLSFRALGYFVIHVLGRRYGVQSPDATLLACSFDQVRERIADRGKHKAPFAESDAFDIAVAYTRAIYVDCEKHETFFGMSAPEFTRVIYSNRLGWAPDGDEAFDDSSYVLQFDVDEGVRLIAFTRSLDGSVDLASLRAAWIQADSYYLILEQWQQAFTAGWSSLPKQDDSA